ncbi:CG31855, partial [Drosophila busckii]
MSVSDFIKGLPIHDSKNFTHLSNDHGIRTSQKRASVYLPTEDVPESGQLIVMDKRCVLLRYLTQQWDKKTLQRKREHGNDGNGNNASSTPSSNSNSKKRPRLDNNGEN